MLRQRPYVAYHNDKPPKLASVIDLMVKINEAEEVHSDESSTFHLHSAVLSYSFDWVSARRQQI